MSSSMGLGWHPIYYMGNKIHVWNHQPVFILLLDDGWPESVEEQGLLLLVLRHYITRQHIKYVLEADEKSSIKDNCQFIDVCFDDLPIYVYIYIYPDAPWRWNIYLDGDAITILKNMSSSMGLGWHPRK